MTGRKLNVGCGGEKLSGYLNIDINPACEPDMVATAQKIELPSESIEEIVSFHLLEHLDRWAAREALQEWWRLLIPRTGRLILELPDLEENMRRFLQGENQRIFNIFGLQRNEWDYHKWGYTSETLRDELRKLNFVDIEQKTPTDYHALQEPCMRIEARKGGR